MPHTNSPLITMKRLLIGSNVYAVKLNDEVVAHAWREIFSNRVISSGWSTFQL